METIGIFEAKTRFSELCEKVFKTKESILITRRGVPIVKIDPVTYADSEKSDIWMAREKFLNKYGQLDQDLEIPERTTESFHNPFDE